jgi:hypothetical protein
MFQYIEAPNNCKIENNFSVFLAGGISGCSNWQKEIVNHFKSYNLMTIINPRRKSFDISKKEETVKQICWEYNRLRESSCILFWFTDETLQPIALYELGAALERALQPIIIGTDINYKRRDDILIQSKLSGYSHPIRKNKKEVIKDLERIYKEYAFD